ncbi:hypothetical protein [cyanobacterium endosymbiont of Rhopalodia gibberula]|uniref:hypothetical protein n=1 Tax=cyanobacterium endosymbiont of Rhopalodia gibberula TaxID=1763363 RepID=UPI0015599C96|nr:hypothetical protein [cyanobacterium endosymbiont of Rhopalodia gibberula]
MIKTIDHHHSEGKKINAYLTELIQLNLLAFEEKIVLMIKKISQQKMFSISSGKVI